MIQEKDIIMKYYSKINTDQQVENTKVYNERTIAKELGKMIP